MMMGINYITTIQSLSVGFAHYDGAADTEEVTPLSDSERRNLNAQALAQLLEGLGALLSLFPNGDHHHEACATFSSEREYRQRSDAGKQAAGELIRALANELRCEIHDLAKADQQPAKQPSNNK